MVSREEAIMKVHSQFNSCTNSQVHKFTKNICEIYDYFEQQLKEKDAEINRLRSQLARGHSQMCECSFCWGMPND